MDLEQLAAAGDENLASAWAMLGRHAGFTVSEADTLTLTASGLPMAFFNGAFAARPAARPTEAISAACSFFAEHAVPFLVWVRDGVDDGLLAAGREAGLRDAGGPPGMVLPEIGEIPAPPAGLEIRLAGSSDVLRAHREVVAAGFGMPVEIAERLVADSLLACDDASIAVGYADGVPVTTALLARSGATAGIYNVATLPDRQGRGYGAAATWAVIAEGARRGCTHSVLQASDAGYPVYRRMGFVDVGRYVQLEGPGTA